MKNINKNSTWLSLTVITLLLFIIGLYAIGFKLAGQDGIITLSTIATRIKAGGAKSYVISSNGLFVSALVFTSIAIILVITKWVLDELNIRTKLANKYWDFVFLGIIILAAILLISGASLFINRLVSDTDFNTTTATKVDSGTSAGLFILIILIIPLNIIPIFMSNGPEDKPVAESASVTIITTEETPSDSNSQSWDDGSSSSTPQDY